MEVTGCGRGKRVVVRIAVVVIRMKQALKISRDVAIAASEYADRHVLFQPNTGLRQHFLRYVRVQGRSRDALLKSANHFVNCGGSGIGVLRVVIQSGKSRHEGHVRLDERIPESDEMIPERPVHVAESRVVFHEQLVDAVENCEVETSHVAQRHRRKRNRF